VKGKTLNSLVAAARESPFRGDRQSTNTPRPSQAQLEDAVLAQFRDLQRERYNQTKLVPIYEVRRRIAARFGATAARHDVLDEIILGLWRNKRIGLEGISDLGKASTDQLNDGIPGISGPLFYLEAVREQPVA
jgi:hypothetical protein